MEIAKSKVRDSNMELLRIVSMLLVMIVHADFRTLGWPSLVDFKSDDLLLRFQIESFSIICVNVFVLLSGWYGIRYKWKRLYAFFFQVFFFLFIGLCIWLYLPNHEKCSFIELIKHLILFGDNDFWFVKCYLFLYICAPILNCFVEKCTREQLLTFIICFFVLQTYLGWVTNGVKWFNGGYSGLSFVGLYLLARFFRLYHIVPITRRPKLFYALAYGLIAVLNGIVSYLVFQKGHIELYKKFFDYNSPIVIVQSVAFLLIFSKIEFKSKIINWVASSCFAVYLLHSSFMGKIIYDIPLKSFYDSHKGFIIIFFFALYICIMFLISILLDKVRFYLWRRIIKE